MKIKQNCSKKVNSFANYLVKNITDKDVNIELVDTNDLPKAPNLLCLGSGENAEIILYNKIEGNFILDCVRGFQGKAKSWDKMTCVTNFERINIPDKSITAEKIKDIQDLAFHVIIGNSAKYNVFNEDGIDKIYPTVIIGLLSQANSCYGTALGFGAQGSGKCSTSLGENSISSGIYSTAVGSGTFSSGEHSAAVGEYADSRYSYSTAIGYDAKTTAAKQIMLGDSYTTPYAHNSLVVTSDKRDQTNIKNIDFNALEFLNKLQPKQYKVDYRFNYKRYEEISKEEYDELDEYTKKAHTKKYPIYELENSIRYINYHHDEENITKTSNRYNPIFKTKDIFLSREEAQIELTKKMNKNGVENINCPNEENVGEIILKEVFLESDGSKVGERYHNGFLAQEVEDTAKSMNFDFAGVKYLAHNGNGEDIYGLAYEEFIAPIVSGIQELSKENNDLKSELNSLKTKNNELESKLNTLIEKLN